MQEEAQGLLHRAEGAEGSAQGLQEEVASLSAALLLKEDQLLSQAGMLSEVGTTNAALASVQQQLQALQTSFKVTVWAHCNRLVACFVKLFAVGLPSCMLSLFNQVLF